MCRIHYNRMKTIGFHDVIQWFPVRTGAFHRNDLTFIFLQPFCQFHQFPGGRTEFPEFFLAFMVQTGNNQFFVYINTTTNVVNFIHINTSGSYLRHGTLSFVSLLYVLSPEMAGQMVVQMRVPEINLAHGLQAQAANDLYRYF